MGRKHHLIYVPVNFLHFWVFDPEKYAQELQSQMTRYPNLLGLAIFGTSLDPAMPKIVLENDCYFAIDKMYGPVTRYFVFVRNLAYNGQLGTDTIAEIYQSFQL